MWPSDRMFRCPTFKNLGLRERADALERYKCCSKCTSWHHQKGSCKVDSKCRNIISGKPCGGSHSSYICGSGSAYTGALRNPALSSSPATCPGSSSGTESLVGSSPPTFPDLNAETLLLFEVVRVEAAEVPPNICWDDGSTRCLVTHKYAKENGFKSQEVVSSR